MDPISIGLAAGSAASGIGSLFGAKKREKRQQKRQIELMGIQHQNQRDLNKQGQELALDYNAQKDAMKKAGLNVGMMYGGQGAAGRTASGGSASGGQAAMDSGAAGMMGISNSLDMAKFMQEKKESDSRIKLNESNANLGDAKTTSELGKIENIIGAGNDILKGQLKDNYLLMEKAKTDEINQHASKMYEETIQANQQNEITRETKDEVIKEINLSAIKSGLENELLKANITKTGEETDKIVNEIYNMWTNTGIKAVDTVLKGVLGGGGVGAMLNLVKGLKGMSGK